MLNESPLKKAEDLQKLFGGSARFYAGDFNCGLAVNHKINFLFPIAGRDTIEYTGPCDFSPVVLALNKGLDAHLQVEDIFGLGKSGVDEKESLLSPGQLEPFYHFIHMHPAINAYMHGINNGVGVPFTGQTFIEPLRPDFSSRQIDRSLILIAQASGAVFNDITRSQATDLAYYLHTCAREAKPNSLVDSAMDLWMSGLRASGKHLTLDQISERAAFAHAFAESFLNSGCAVNFTQSRRTEPTDYNLL